MGEEVGKGSALDIAEGWLSRGVRGGTPFSQSVGLGKLCLKQGWHLTNLDYW